MNLLARLSPRTQPNPPTRPGPRIRPLIRLQAGSRRHRILRAAVLTLAVVVAVGFPFNSEPFVNGQMTLMMTYAVAALGLNLLIGYAGQISLGHGAFFAIGAYTVAILIVKAGVPYLLTLPAAGLVTFALGYAFGVPALRLHGLYLALVTLGLTIAVGPVIRRLDGLTNGAQGMSVPQPDVPAWLPLDHDQYLYLLVLAVTAVVFLIGVNLTRGALGRALIAVRGNERAATTMGVDRARLKTRAFAWSAAFAGVAGGLFTFTLGFVAPEAFTLTLSFNFLAAIVVGGLGTVGGALLGAAFIEFVPQYAEGINQALTGVIYGAVLILVMYVVPSGAAGLLRRLWRLVVEVAEPPPATGAAADATATGGTRTGAAAAGAGPVPPTTPRDEGPDPVKEESGWSAT